MPSAPLKTFIIYARDDEEYKRQLLLHLRPLVVSRLLSVWHDGNIQPGEDWEKAIKKELKGSELVIMLVSVHTLNSDFIQTEELRTALDQLDAGLTRVVPIVVSPCVWRFDPVIRRLQALPSGGTEGVLPVSEWKNHNLAWASVVETIGDLAQGIHDKREEAERAEQEIALLARQEAERLTAEQERKKQEAAEQIVHEQREKAERAKEEERQRLEIERLAKIEVEREAEKKRHEAELEAAQQRTVQEGARIEQERQQQWHQAHNEAWALACNEDTQKGYKLFLRSYSNSPNASEAHLRIKQIRQAEQPSTPWMLWVGMGGGVFVFALIIWLAIGPDNKPDDKLNIQVSEKPIPSPDEVALQKAKSENTLPAWGNFRHQYHNSKYIEEATTALNQLQARYVRDLADARVFMKIKDFESARTLLDTVLRINPGDAEALRLLKELHQKK